MRESQPVDISVIIVTYDRDATLRQTLECVLSQEPAAREIIVVDQSKQHDDVTQQFLRRLIEKQQITYIFQTEPNAQKARNRAIAEASSEILLFLDDDVVMDKQLVGAHWQNYSDAELAAVCGFYTEPGETELEELPDDCKRNVTGWIYFPHCYNKRTDCYLLPTCNGSIRREVAIRLGGFDENYTYTLLDDTDLSCRLMALGVKAVHDPRARLVHLKESSGGKRPGGINEYVIADSNRWYTWCYFFWMNFRWSGWREIASRMRSSIFRRKNITRPWYLFIALAHFTRGALRAAKAVRGGRRLGFGQGVRNAAFAPEHGEGIESYPRSSGLH